MVQFKVRLDYLSLTGKLSKVDADVYPDSLLSRAKLAENLLSWLGVKKAGLQAIPPARYYAFSFVDRHSKFRINMGQDLSAQGWQVVISGEGCMEFDAVSTLKSFLEVWHGKATRCDVAIDLIDTGITPESIADEYREEFGSSAAKSWSFIKGKTGDTFYLGSRSSERMLRAYDKGGEQGIPVDWLRVEMEYKGDYAQHALETFLHDYRSSVASTADFIPLPNSLLVTSLRKIAMGQIAEKRTTPKVVTDRVKWFNGQVMQAYYKLAAEDIEAAREIWEKFHDIYMAQAIWNMFLGAGGAIAESPVHSEL